jgi:hypothetical protein
MRRKLVALMSATALTISLLAGVPAAEADTLDDLLIASPINVGVTLGQGWSGFPTYLQPDYVQTGALDRLDVELPLYVTWILDRNVPGQVEAQPVIPPQPITSYSWFDPTKLKVAYAVIQEANLYTECLEGVQLEAPAVNSFPLTADGRLRVTDRHGGTGVRRGSCW